MFEWLKSLLSGEPTYVGIDTSGELQSGDQYRLILKPTVAGTENLIVSQISGKVVPLGSGKEVKVINAQVVYEKDGPRIVAVVEPVIASQSGQQAKVGLGVSFTAVISALALLGFVFSIDRVEKAVDSGTSNLLRLGVLALIIMLVWRFLIRRK